jgi:hypothetical protein
MHRCLKVLAVLTIGVLASLPGILQLLRAGEPNSVTAVDILLEPDAISACSRASLLASL